MNNRTAEILINASLVVEQGLGDTFEFVLNRDLQVLECVRLEKPDTANITLIKNPCTTLMDVLFELNHVRVNPQLDNSIIIDTFVDALTNIGVNVRNKPSQDLMKVCYKPVGEITDNVRFYLHHGGTVTFLSSATRPRLVAKR